MSRSVSPEAFKRRMAIILLCVAAAIVLVVAGVVAVSLFPGKQTANASQPTTTSPTHTGSTPTAVPAPSPLLFGTNLGLFTNNDQVLTSTTTRQMMQQMHVRIIRMPFRSNLSNDTELQAAQAIKSIGAVPLIVLSGMRDPNVLANDTRIVNDMNSVFGNSLVYYEFGNEDDWNGLPISSYTSGWNTIIPQMKKLALNGKFIGPVSYQYDTNNLTTFLQGANPRPDAISWHEYTCSYKDPADLCISSIDKWTAHITDARQVMQITLGTVLPIMITEWNYAADQSTQSNGQPIPDNKYNNSTFMSAWTTKALQTLAQNQVFASMQYSVTNTALPMITFDNTMTVQGSTFQSLYQKIIGAQ